MAFSFSCSTSFNPPSRLSYTAQVSLQHSIELPFCFANALIPGTNNTEKGQRQDFHGYSPCAPSTTSGSQSPHALRIWAAGGKSVPPRQGRGYNARKSSSEGIQKRMSNRDLDQAGWVQVAEKGDLIEGKNKAIIHNDNGYVVVQRGSLIYTIKANCTSCQFPMIDGKVEVVGEGDDLTMECPLCHSKFSLVDGDVKEYCPKDGPLQWFIGTLKDKAQPLAAKVKAAIVTCGGLCPGLNDVIRQIVFTLELYGVKEILGIQYGFKGFVDPN